MTSDLTSASSVLRLQQTYKVEMRLKVARQMSVLVAPLQHKLDAVKLELQQLRGKEECSHS